MNDYEKYPRPQIEELKTGYVAQVEKSNQKRLIRNVAAGGWLSSAALGLSNMAINYLPGQTDTPLMISSNACALTMIIAHDKFRESKVNMRATANDAKDTAQEATLAPPEWAVKATK